MKYIVIMMVDNGYSLLCEHASMCESMDEVEWEVNDYWTKYYEYKTASCEVYTLNEPIDVTAIKERACERIRKKAEEEIRTSKIRSEQREREEYLRLKEKYGGT